MKRMNDEDLGFKLIFLGWILYFYIDFCIQQKSFKKRFIWFLVIAVVSTLAFLMDLHSLAYGCLILCIEYCMSEKRIKG